MFHPANARPGRRKLFTDGKQTPIDRNDRAKLMRLAEESRRRGNITRAAVDILRVLAFTFANLRDGRCFPSHQRIGEAAGCCARTVGRSLRALEEAGLVTWIHRLRRIVERVEGVLVRRVIRASNSYDFPALAKNPGKPADGHFGRGTSNQVFPSAVAAQRCGEIAPDTPLGEAILRYREVRERRIGAT